MLEEHEVLNLIEEALAISANGPVVITLDSERASVEGWDSMGQLSVMVHLDARLNGALAGMTELADAKSVREILRLLRGRGLCH